MILYYDQQGIIRAVIPDRDKYIKAPPENTQTIEVDEISENQELIFDILRYARRFNENGEAKYYIQDGNLYSVTDWTEQEE